MLKTRYQGLERAASFGWGAPFVTGLLMTLAGWFLFIIAGATSLASVYVLGVFLIGAGIVGLADAFRHGDEEGRLAHVLTGVLSIVVGVLVLIKPLTSLRAVTILLGAFFFASGLYRGITAIVDRYRNWGWDLFYGIVSVFLSVVVLRTWPTSSYWLLGALVGAEIAVRGTVLMAAGLTVRRMMKHGGRDDVSRDVPVHP